MNSETLHMIIEHNSKNVYCEKNNKFDLDSFPSVKFSILFLLWIKKIE